MATDINDEYSNETTLMAKYKDIDGDMRIYLAIHFR
jgi:hypothetical protein